MTAPRQKSKSIDRQFEARHETKINGMLTLVLVDLFIVDREEGIVLHLLFELGFGFAFSL